MDEPAPLAAANILLVEDDPADLQLVKEALQEGKVPNHVSVVNDGVQAMSYLHGEDPYGQAILPDLILLDLEEFDRVMNTIRDLFLTVVKLPPRD
jgi:CheY-like chemotaxis protein